MTLIPFYCSDEVLRMFIANYKRMISYCNWKGGC